MGLIGLLKLAVICIDFLAWPVIALGYPLFASIKAVETGSKYHMRKLVIYWTIFALISLFEFAFVKIIEWIPFWSSIRLVAIFWLVMPQFDGACHAYNSLVRHVLLVNLQAVIDKLYRRKEEKLCRRATFLDVAEQYIKENGSEALEKLISSKAMQHECKDCSNFLGDIQVLESEEKNAVQTLKLLKEPDAALHHHGTLKAPNCAATEAKWGAATTAMVKETTPLPETNVVNKSLETPPLKKTQQRIEWTCDLCKVKMTNEKMLNARLQGWKHKSNCESLRASMLHEENAKTSQLETCKLYQRNIKIGTDAVTANFKETTPPETGAQNCCSATPTIKKVQQEWTCDLCNVKNTGEKTLNDHLQGSKHKSKCELLKANELSTKDIGPSPSVIGKLNQGNFDFERDLAAATVIETKPGSAENSCPETPVTKEVQQEWTCGLCNVKTCSEKMLNDHLKGGKHKSDCEFLKDNELNVKDTGHSPAATCKLNQCNLDPGTCVTTAKVKESVRPETSAENSCPETPMVKKVQQERTRDLFKVKTTCDKMLSDHLQGSKYKSDTGPSSSAIGKLSQNNIDFGTDAAAAKVKESTPPEGSGKNSLPETPAIKEVQQHEFKECDNSERDIQVVEPLVKNAVATSEQHDSGTIEATRKSAASEVKRVQYAQPKPTAWVPKGTEAAAAKVKEAIPPEASVENRWPETPPIKRVQLKEPVVSQHDNETLEATKKSASIEGKWVQTAQYAQSKTTAWVPKGTGAGATKVKDTPSHEAIAENRLLETPPIKKVQQERTFDENAHLQGSKHNFKYALKDSTLDSERGIQAVLPEDKYAAATSIQVLNGQSKTAASAWVPKGSETAAAKAKEAAPPEASAENKQIEWTCDLCRVAITSEKTLNAHLQGTTHKSNCDSLKTSMLNAKDTGLSPKGSGKSHHTTLVEAVENEARQTSSVKTLDKNQFQTKWKPEGAANQIFKWHCVLCDVKLISDIDLAAHLRGKRHLANIKTMPNLKGVFS